MMDWWDGKVEEWRNGEISHNAECLAVLNESLTKIELQRNKKKI